MHVPPQICEGGVRMIDFPCPLNAYRLDRNVLPMIAEFHRHGFRIDTGALGALSAELDSLIEQTQIEIDFWAGRELNPNSGDQLAEYLFDECKLVPPTGLKLTRSRSRYSVDDDTLQSLRSQHPIIGPCIDQRHYRKLKSTYVDKLPQMISPETGRLHTTFNPANTETGRLSSESPNLQNIPVRTRLGARIRSAFVADSRLPVRTTLLSADYSQIEMLLAGQLSGDEVMLQAFRENADIHTLTALSVFPGLDVDRLLRLSQQAKREDGGEKVQWLEDDLKYWREFKSRYRLPAKTIGFGILYGQTALGAQSNIVAQGGPLYSEQQCEEMIRSWFVLYDGVRRWTSEQHSRAVRYGMVWDMFGRLRRVAEAMSTVERVRSSGLRAAGNMPIQASAQGVIKLAMAALIPLIESYRAMGALILPLLQIHDELIFEVEDSAAPEFARDAKAVMESVVRLDVPLLASASTADNWGALK